MKENGLRERKGEDEGEGKQRKERRGCRKDEGEWNEGKERRVCMLNVRRENKGEDVGRMWENG